MDIPAAPQVQIQGPPVRSVEAWLSQAETIHALNMQRYTTFLKAQIQPNVTGGIVGPQYFYKRSRDACVRVIRPDHTFNSRVYPYGQ